MENYVKIFKNAFLMLIIILFFSSTVFAIEETSLIKNTFDGENLYLNWNSIVGTPVQENGYLRSATSGTTVILSKSFNSDSDINSNDGMVINMEYLEDGAISQSVPIGYIYMKDTLSQDIGTISITASTLSNNIAFRCNNIDNIGQILNVPYTPNQNNTLSIYFNYSEDTLHISNEGNDYTFDSAFRGGNCDFDSSSGDYVSQVKMGTGYSFHINDYELNMANENPSTYRVNLFQDFFNNSNYVSDGWSFNSLCTEGTYLGNSVLKFSGGDCTTGQTLNYSADESSDIVLDLNLINYGQDGNFLIIGQSGADYVRFEFNYATQKILAVSHGVYASLGSFSDNYVWTSNPTLFKIVYNKQKGFLKYYLDGTLIRTINNSLISSAVLNYVNLKSKNNGAVYDSIELYQDFYYECSDGLDNDNDGYIDSEDIDCNSYMNNESIYQTSECNDGIDNDNDGYIDYPDDSSCTDEFDNSESPQQATSCDLTACSESEGCIYYLDKMCNDPISAYGLTLLPDYLNDFASSEKYNTFDVINLNEFLGYGLITDSGVETTENMTIEKQFDKDNNYPIINNRIVFFFEDSGLRNGIKNESVEYSLYSNSYDNINRILHLKLYPYPISTSEIKVDIYNVDMNGNETYVGSSKASKNYLFGRFELNIEMDTDNQNFRLLWRSSDGAGATVDNIDYLIYTFSVPDRFKILSYGDPSKYSSTYSAEVNMYLSTLQINGKQSEENTFCTTWESPYALKEDFVGRITDCGWSANKDLYFYSKLDISEDLEIYDAYKDFSPIYESSSRYATTDFIFSAESFAGSEGYVLIQGFGSSETKDFALYFSKSDDNQVEIGYFADGSFYSVAKYPFSQGLRVQVVMDFTLNTWKLVINQEDTYSGLKIPNKLQDPSDMSRIKIFSYKSAFVLDTLKIFPSDENSKIVGGSYDYNSEVLDPFPNWAGDTMCGYFQSKNIPDKYCTQDSDCDTMKCSPSGKCLRFDYSYCDKNGKKRDGTCILSSAVSCGLVSAKNGILNNFALFLVFVIIIIIIIYIIIMTRGK